MSILSYIVALYLSVTLDVGNVEQTELECMVANVWHEARGEDTLGYILVAQTVRNRIRFNPTGTSACAVIWAPGQFSWTFDDLPDDVSPTKLTEMAKLEEITNLSALALAGSFDGILSGATQYYAHNKVTPCFKSAYDDFLIVGNHTWGLKPNNTTPCWDRRIASK